MTHAQRRLGLFQLALLSTLLFAAFTLATAADSGLNLALFATPATSFVSPHEKLDAINDGSEPGGVNDKSHGCYGNFPKKGTQWVELAWEQPVCTRKVDVYWWDDSHGVRLPVAARLLYWDGKEFAPVKGDTALGVVGGRWNTATFAEVKTTKLRLEFDSQPKFSTGIIEWKVHDSGNSPKLAPRVTAGANRTVVLPARVRLQGSVRGAVESVEWSKQSGPGNVTFSNAKALATSAAFSKPGDYVLNLVGINGGQSASDTLSVHVEPMAFAGAAATAEIPPLATLAVKNAAPVRAEPFDLADVRLLESPFKQARETDRAYLLELEPMRFLAFFQKHAGLLEGDVFLGWEPKGLGGGPAKAMIGHYLSACSSMYRATGDPKLAERVNMLVAGLAKCQQVSGNAGLLVSNAEKKAFEEWAAGNLRAEGNRLNGIGIPWYDTSKLYNGLFDAYHLCGNKQSREVLVRLADWCASVVGKFDDAQLQQMLAAEHGDIADALANVYAMTGEPRHLALAKKFRHDSVFAPIAVGTDCLDMMHANTQIPKFRGYQRTHELTGEAYWGNAASNFWRFVALERSYANGGNSYHEHFHPRDKFEEAMRVTPGPETCNTYNMLRLTHHLFTETGDATKLDYYERALYNQILPSQHPRGGFTYYQGVLPGAYRTYSDREYIFWCCVGTGMQNHGLYGEAIYAHQGDRLLVNLFIPSELNWHEQGARITQTTAFPDEPRTKLQMKLSVPKQFTVAVRHPAWIAPGQLKLAVNGQPVPAKSRPGSYADVTREWKDGDVLSVELPMNLRTEMLPNSTSYVAVFYGPILLAAKLGREGLADEDFRGVAAMPAKNKLPAAKLPTIVVPVAEIAAHIEKAAGDALQFKTRDLCRPVDATLVPVNRIYDERYSAYFRLTSHETWEQDKARWTAEEQRERELESLTVDEVRVGEQQPEVDHMMQSLRSQASRPGQRPDIGRLWREAVNGGWFSYEMKVDPNKPMALLCTYWGGDNGPRGFNVLVNDKVIATEGIVGSAGEFVQRLYAIPAEPTRGKSVIRVKFLAHGGKLTAKVFDCRTLIGK
ncbi:MAG: glycoside hydrolase family 127 protein [Verrucomicrobia bacterium]|nr:glycoside hydrolase family 127 protein [Verrucomicrobiota bacterium]